MICYFTLVILYFQQSDMHGGRLHFGCHLICENNVFAAYGPSLYVFEADSQICRGRYNLGHNSDIIGMSQMQKNQFISVDSEGTCIKFTFSKEKNPKNEQLFDVTDKFAIGTEKNKKRKNISQALIRPEGNVYFLTEDSKLRKYFLQAKSTVTVAHRHSFTKILHICEKWIIGLVDDKRAICLSTQDEHHEKEYIHANQIESATISSQSLIVGDRKGKIYIISNFLSRKNISYPTKLEWHTGPVHCLLVSGQYLYSAGEESVVVLWHLKNLSRDFLPRVGTAIRSLWVSEMTNEILCGMSDNSVKIIDLGNDKQTKHYKVISDPSGYAPNQQTFVNCDTIHYNPINDEIIMNGLPGRLQCINFRANGENSEIEIIPRNLINQLDDNTLNPNRISGFCLSKDWSTMMVCVQQSFKCSLKFYRRKFGHEFQLISKVQNPHPHAIDGFQYLPSQTNNDRFVTYSASDRSVKIWKEQRERKKSIIETDEIYWKCQQEISYRQMNPVSVCSGLDSLVVLFDENLVLYKMKQNKLLERVQNFSMGPLSNGRISKVSILYENKTNKMNILCINNENNGFKVLQWDLSSNSMSIHGSFDRKSVNKVQICMNENMCAIILEENKKDSHILILQRNTLKFTQSHKCPIPILAGFWRTNQLILFSHNLILQSLDGKDFVKYQKMAEDSQMDEQSTRARQVYTATQLDIYSLNEKWIGREVMRKKKKIDATINNAHLLADCTSALQELARNMLV